MYQSPLERSRLRKESADSILSKTDTPVKPSKDITTVESFSKENTSVSSSLSNVEKTNTVKPIEPKKRGRKRKVTSSPSKSPKDQVCKETEPNKPKKLKF